MAARGYEVIVTVTGRGGLPDRTWRYHAAASRVDVALARALGRTPGVDGSRGEVSVTWFKLGQAEARALRRGATVLVW